MAHDGTSRKGRRALQPDQRKIDQQGTDDNRSLNRDGKQASNLCGRPCPVQREGIVDWGELAGRPSDIETLQRQGVPVFALRVRRDIAERADGATD